MEDQNNQDSSNKNLEVEDKTTKFFRNKKFFWLVVLILAFSVIGAGAFFIFKSKLPPGFPLPISSPKPSSSAQPSVTFKTGVEKFTSEEEFKAYLKKAEESFGSFLGISPGFGLERSIEDTGIAVPSFEEGGFSVKESVPGRVSETTVQVKGIDEPDIVKTDGKQIYLSSDFRVYPLLEREVIGDMEKMPQMRGETKIIKAFPPADLAQKAGIDKTGNLLLSNKILVIFSGNDIFGFDVSNPESPEEKWQVELKNNSNLIDVRLYKNKVYLVTRTRVNTTRPCPIVPLSAGGIELNIRCTDIYHPVADVPVDVTYTAMVIDSASGQVNNSLSFVGSSGSSVVYMSENAIYITYTYFGDIIEFFLNFFVGRGKDLIPDSLIEKLRKLQGYDISSMTKLTEFQLAFDEYKNSLDDDERLKIENEFTNRMQDYAQEHIREMEKTGIAKIELTDFKIEATGGVPGRPLNQFSLDEYKDHLRIATTIGGGMFGFGPSESANDVHVLDKDLKTVGSVKDLGLTERIYSVRFIEDKGYVVTFRQIDPFYVLDLSNPSSPEKKGELKIPGYSSYLHPITKDKILGIGKEGSQVKLSLFDVSSLENPTETAKYMLEEYWSDILNTHHAFLLDTKHKVFFLPGSKGGYVFSYQGDELKLIKAVSDIRARRAIYLDDYMYIIGDDKLVVLNEQDWQKVNQLEF